MMGSHIRSHMSIAALCVAGSIASGCVRQRVPLDPRPITATARHPRATVADDDGSGGSNGAAGSGAADGAVPLMSVGVLAGAPAGSAEADVRYLLGRRLAVPVAGVSAAALHDSFDDARGDDRRHRAIDILAPRGTPVVAADDGRIIRMSWNRAGGNTIYAVDDADRIVYYYAHLDHYRDGLAAGAHVVRGDTIGFVGTTGNAPPDVPHLHFQVMRMAADGRYWEGEPLNPYGLFQDTASAAR